MPNPPPPPLNRKDRAVQFHDTLQLATSSTFASKRFVPFFFCSRLVSSIALNQLKLPQLNVAATPNFHISVSLYLPQLNVAATPHFHISVSLYLLMLPLPFRKVGEFCKRVPTGVTMACCSGWIVEYTLNSTRHMLEVLLIACSCPGHLPAVIRIALVGDGGGWFNGAFQTSLSA